MQSPVSQEVERPLCVDLDGTLVKSDTLVDSLLLLARSRPAEFLQTPLWAFRGKAYLKREVTARVSLNVEHLPYNRTLLEYLLREHGEGRRLYLATGAEGSFCVWKKSYFPRPRPPIGEEIAGNPALRRMGEFILVSNRALPTDSIRSAAGNYRLQALRSFDNSIIGENYWVYQVDPF